MIHKYNRMYKYLIDNTIASINGRDFLHSFKIFLINLSYNFIQNDSSKTQQDILIFTQNNEK